MPKETTTEVAWLSLSNNILDNKKMKMIDTLPERDAIFRIWVGLLCLSSKTNDNGWIYFLPTMPYTIEMLSKEFDRQQSTIRLALETFGKLQMLEINQNGGICISNWGKYQHGEALVRIRENNRIRQAKYRERSNMSLQLRDSNVTVTLPDTLASRDTCLDNTIQNNTETEERIIFKNAHEEISEDIFKPVQPTEPPKAKRRTVDVSEFDQVLESWDQSGVLPEYRLRRGNISSADTAPVFDSMSLFTAEEIQEAVKNYIALKSELAKYKPFGYATPITFLTKGIAAHLNQSNPFENFAIQRGKSQPANREASPTPKIKPAARICPKCGKPENVQLTAVGQPWCHECFGWHFDHQEAM